MKKIYNDYLSVIKNNFEENHTAALNMMAALRKSPVAYHGRCVYTLQIPKVFTPEDVKRFDDIVNITYGIFTKVIQEYLNNPSYRKTFPFSKELEELILLSRGYDSLLPIARFDIFYNEETGDFKFCEINTDGTSAMLEDYTLNKMIHMNPAHEAIKQTHNFDSWELFDSWVSTFIQIYKTCKNAVPSPNIAIADFLEGGSITEFDEFRNRFQAAGYCCEVCEITKLKYENGKLYSEKGMPIDVIYRRAVTTDIMSHIDEIPDFINAVKDQAVYIIGSFCTQIIHNKWLFKALWEKETQNLLTQSEIEFVKAHVPYTNLLEDSCCNIQDIIKEKDRWIIKPLDSYGSKGVFAGCDDTVKEWESHVKEAFNNDYIYQEYCPPYRTTNICFVEEDYKFKEYTNMSGLFVYNGKFSGVYSRLSDGGIISSQYNERAVPSLILKSE